MRRSCQMHEWLADVKPASCTHETCCEHKGLEGIGWTELLFAMRKANMTDRRKVIVIYYLKGMPKHDIEMKLKIGRSGLNKAIRQGMKAIKEHDRGVVTAIIDTFGMEGFAEVADAYS